MYSVGCPGSNSAPLQARQSLLRTPYDVYDLHVHFWMWCNIGDETLVVGVNLDHQGEGHSAHAISVLEGGREVGCVGCTLPVLGCGEKRVEFLTHSF